MLIPLEYKFLSRDPFSKVRAWMTEGIDKLQATVLQYFNFMALLYHDELAVAIQQKQWLMLKEARYYVNRFVSALIREGVKIRINAANNNETVQDAADKYLKDFWLYNMMDAKLRECEQEASVKGRSAALYITCPDGKKLRVQIVKPEYVFFEQDPTGRYTKFTFRYPTEATGGDKEQKLYYQTELFVDPKAEGNGRTLRTSGHVYFKDNQFKYDSYDTFEDETGKKVQVKNYDMGIDFLPVVFWNNLPGNEQVPISDLHAIFDAMILKFRAWFDEDTVAQLMASPPLVIEAPDPAGKLKSMLKRTTKAVTATVQSMVQQAATIVMSPKRTIFTGKNGAKAYPLDCSKSLELIQKFIGDLDNKMFRDSQLTKVGAGALDTNDWPAWETVELVTQPMRDLVLAKRGTRTQKIVLFLILSFRYAIAKQILTLAGVTRVEDALSFEVVWPYVIPKNPNETSSNAITAFREGGISHRTFLDNTPSMGIEIPSTQEELDRLDEEKPDYTAQPPVTGQGG